MNKFHISLPCKSVSKTKKFYSETLGFPLGRCSSNWVDVNLYENQITFCKAGTFDFDYKNYKFEKTILPSFHFGVIMDLKSWNILYKKLSDLKLVAIGEKDFLQDKKGEHKSFFVKDPNDYYLEFKCFKKAKDCFVEG